MSTSDRRTILSAGIARPTDPSSKFQYPEEVYNRNQALIAAGNEEARKMGYDVHSIDLSPNMDELPQTLELLREKLRSQRWDGFQVGFGIRANKDFTPLFEAEVNAVRDITPGTRMLFANAPDGLVEAIQRVFPPEDK